MEMHHKCGFKWTGPMPTDKSTLMARRHIARHHCDRNFNHDDGHECRCGATKIEEVRNG